MINNAEWTFIHQKLWICQHLERVIEWIVLCVCCICVPLLQHTPSFRMSPVLSSCLVLLKHLNETQLKNGLVICHFSVHKPIHNTYKSYLYVYIVSHRIAITKAPIANPTSMELILNPVKSIINRCLITNSIEQSYKYVIQIYIEEKLVCNLHAVSWARGPSWNCWLAVPWLFVPTHCRVSVNDAGRVMKLLRCVMLNCSSLMNVFVELLTGRPDTCHSTLGEGFPWASHENTIISPNLEEFEIWGASKKYREILLFIVAFIVAIRD